MNIRLPRTPRLQLTDGGQVVPTLVGELRICRDTRVASFGPVSSSSWTKQSLEGTGRWAVDRPCKCAHAGAKAEGVRVKSISCRMGNHNWAFRDNNDGERIRECSRCGAIENAEPPRSVGSTFIFPGDS